MHARDAGEELARVKATRAHLEPQVARLRGELADLNESVAATPEPTSPAAAPEVNALEEHVRRLQAEQPSAAAALGATEQRLAQARKGADKTAKLDGEHSAVKYRLRQLGR